MRFWPKRLGAVALGMAVVGAGLTVGTTAASAQTPTSMTLTVKPGHTISGQAVLVEAKVAFTKIPRKHIYGRVTFSATDAGSNPVELNCNLGDAPRISWKGLAHCTVPPGTLLAGAGPYTVTATYAGDANNEGTSATVTLAPAIARTNISLRISPRIANDTANTATARITAGVGTKGISSGAVQFFIFSSGHTANLQCKNGTGPLKIVVQLSGSDTAACELPSGWVHVFPGQTKVKWSIGATYFGNTSYKATVNKPVVHRGVLKAPKS